MTTTFLYICPGALSGRAAEQQAETFERAARKLSVGGLDDMRPVPIPAATSVLGRSLAGQLQKLHARVTFLPKPTGDWHAAVGHPRDSDAFRDAPHALNPALDFEAMEREYGEKGIVVRDEFLTPEAMADLRAYCVEGTGVFNEPQNGYTPHTPHNRTQA